MAAVITTARLVLRHIESDDVTDLIALETDPAVMRYLTNGEPAVADRIRIEITRSIREYRNFPGLGKWVVQDRHCGVFVGWMSLRIPKHSYSARGMEIMYRLRPDSWGRGLATEAARAVVTHAFNNLDAERVYATTMAANAGSRRVLEKSGMEMVRRFFQSWDSVEGFEQGEVEYQLTRQRWQSGVVALPPQRARRVIDQARAS